MLSTHGFGPGHETKRKRKGATRWWLDEDETPADMPGAHFTNPNHESVLCIWIKFSTIPLVHLQVLADLCRTYHKLFSNNLETLFVNQRSGFNCRLGTIWSALKLPTIKRLKGQFVVCKCLPRFPASRTRHGRTCRCNLMLSTCKTLSGYFVFLLSSFFLLLLCCFGFLVVLAHTTHTRTQTDNSSGSKTHKHTHRHLDTQEDRHNPRSANSARAKICADNLKQFGCKFATLFLLLLLLLAG